MEGDYCVRLARPEDAERLVTLVERCYQGTYTNPAALDPQQVAREIASQRSLLALVETAAGEAVGTGALELVNHRAGIYGRCVVDLEHRGRGLLGRIGQRLVLEEAPARGLGYVHSSVVTNHAYAQQHCADLGATASGLLLGLYPDDMRMRGIGGVNEPVSAAQLVFSHDRNPECRRLGLGGSDLRRARRVLDAFEIPSSRQRRAESAQFAWHTVERPGLGLVHLQPIPGDDEAPDLSQCFDARLVWVDVPVTDGGAQLLIDGLRERGFCYGAYLLGLGPRGGDVVRMQRYQGPGGLSEDAVVMAAPYTAARGDVFADYRASLAVAS